MARDKKKTYPKGTKFGEYFRAKDSTLQSGFCIRRRVTLPDGTKSQERLDSKIYAHLKDDREIEALLDRLNHRTERKKLEAEAMERIKTRIAFLPPDKLEKFRLEFCSRYAHAREQNYSEALAITQDYYNQVLGLSVWTNTPDRVPLPSRARFRKAMRNFE